MVLSGWHAAAGQGFWRKARQDMAGTFPEGFLIGGATSDWQYEGGFGEGGRGLLTVDFATDGDQQHPRQITWKDAEGRRGETHWEHALPEGVVPTMFEDQYYPSHRAVDFYHHYEEDISLMAEMGFTVFRFSTCWARVIPTGEGPVNEEGLDFYEKVVDCCLAHHIEPLITICHDEMPLELAQKYDGWHGRETIDCYVRYATALFDRLKGKVKYWLTFNEPNALAGFAMLGVTDQSEQVYWQSMHHLFVASAKVVQIGHALMPDAQFSTMYAMSEIYPGSCKPGDVFCAYQKRREQYLLIDVMSRGAYPRFAHQIFSDAGVEVKMELGDEKILAAGTLDFVSFSYYRSTVAYAGDTWHRLGGTPNPLCSEKTPWGWAVDPLGLRYCMNELYDRYQKPVFVVENGMGAIDEFDPDGACHDVYRMKYLAQHLQAMKDAMDIDQVPCLGYTMWGPVDLVSRSTGEMAKRYGFVAVDMDDKGRGTLARSRKDSFFWFKKVLASWGADLSVDEA